MNILLIIVVVLNYTVGFGNLAVKRDKINRVIGVVNIIIAIMLTVFVISLW